MTFKEWEEQAEYKQEYKFVTHGTEIQICSLVLPYNVKVFERTIFPWNFLKNPKTYYCLDIVLPVSYEKSIVKYNGTFNTEYYTDEGYGLAEFNNLEDSFNFNEWYNLNKVKI